MKLAVEPLSIFERPLETRYVSTSGLIKKIMGVGNQKTHCLGW